MLLRESFNYRPLAKLTQGDFSANLLRNTLAVNFARGLIKK